MNRRIALDSGIVIYYYAFTLCSTLFAVLIETQCRRMIQYNGKVQFSTAFDTCIRGRKTHNFQKISTVRFRKCDWTRMALTIEGQRFSPPPRSTYAPCVTQNHGGLPWRWSARNRHHSKRTCEQQFPRTVAWQ